MSIEDEINFIISDQRHAYSEDMKSDAAELATYVRSKLRALGEEITTQSLEPTSTTIGVIGGQMKGMGNFLSIVETAVARACGEEK